MNRRQFGLIFSFRIVYAHVPRRGETRRRERVAFTPELRGCVERMLAEMRQYHERGHTPSARRTKICNACSLKEICLPGLEKLPKVNAYLNQHLKEDEPCENS